MPNADNCLFVYGTLRIDAPNSDRAPGPVANAIAAARHVGRGSVAGNLYWVSWYPGMVPDEAAESRVIGDVFELPADADLWAAFDAYEEASTDPHSNAEYIRRKIRVHLDDGRAQDAWAYIYNHPERLGRRIANGDFLSETPPAS